MFGSCYVKIKKQKENLMAFLIDFEIFKLLKVRQKSELRKHFTFCILCKFYPDLFFLFAHEYALEVDVFIHNFPLSQSFRFILMWWLCNNLVVVSCYSLGYMCICKKNHSTINTKETFFYQWFQFRIIEEKIWFLSQFFLLNREQSMDDWKREREKKDEATNSVYLTN